jgi:hypothetical protein
MAPQRPARNRLILSSSKDEAGTPLSITRHER